jgi:hypothetical protein
MWERAPICPAAAGLRRAEAIRGDGMQLGGELGASKRKQIKAKPLSFAFFYLRLFFRIGTFQ